MNKQEAVNKAVNGTIDQSGLCLNEYGGMFYDEDSGFKCFVAHLLTKEELERVFDLDLNLEGSGSLKDREEDFPSLKGLDSKFLTDLQDVHDFTFTYDTVDTDEILACIAEFEQEHGVVTPRLGELLYVIQS